MSDLDDHIRRLTAFLERQRRQAAASDAAGMSAESANIATNVLAGHLAADNPHPQYALAGGGMTDPTTTQGDLIYRGAVSVTRLGIGSDDAFLRVVGGVPAWVALTWAMVGSTPTTLAGYGITDAVPGGRQITINGEAHDLSEDRSFTVSGSGLTIEEADGTPSVLATKLVLPNGTLSISGTEATYTPTTGAGGAPTDATYVTLDAHAELSAEAVLGTDVLMSGAYASLPAASKAGKIYLPTDAPYVLRDTGADWQAWGPITRLTIPPSSGWSWVNQGGATLDDSGGAQTINAPTTSGESARVRTRAAPATPYTITALVALDVLAVNYHNAGIGFRQSSDGKMSVIRWQTGDRVQPLNWSTATSVSGNVGTSVIGPWPVDRLWLRIADDGTNRTYSVSASGRVWRVLYTIGRTTFLTADEVCFYIDLQNATHSGAITLLSWAVS